MSVRSSRVIVTLAGGVGLSILTACSGAQGLLDRFNLRGNADGEAQVAQPATVAEDVEAPEVFSAVDAGLWDGRPSLGGIWVAHPDVDEPERVLIRNTANGRSVVGALFRRERAVPGPVLQVSSDAAEALGLVAGTPQQMEVVALRRKEVPVAAAPAAAPDGSAPAATMDESAPREDVIETARDPVAIATDAIYSVPESGAGAAGTD